jgi:membrane protein DedA with SNARE-associated domain
LHWFREFIVWYFQQINHIGLELYVFVGMLIESTVFPLPSEIIMPPAAHQAAQHGGFARVFGLILLGTAGSLLGGYINYFVARLLGRPFFDRYGKYFLLNRKHMQKVDLFWERYGEMSTFTGRLVPGVRHLISIPAGIARMNVWKFTLYTSTGAGFWVTVLALTGWFLRGWTATDFETKLKGKMTPYVLAGVALLIVGYFAFAWWRKRNAREKIGSGKLTNLK